MPGGAGLPEPVSAALDALPPELRRHVQVVRRLARELAEPLGVDLAAVDLAAAAHDAARATPGPQLLAQAHAYGIEVDPVEERLPMLLHGPVAAAWLRSRVGVSDPQVLDAVRWHTTGRESLGPVARVVFLADKLDPEKEARYPEQAAVREMAARDLDGAIMAFLTGDLVRLLREGRTVHPASIRARNALLWARGGGAPPP